MAYSSFAGPDSLGNLLKEEFESRASCNLKIINGGSSSELESKIYIQPKRYDVVIGLQYKTELSDKIKWASLRKQFSYSPMIILIKGEDVSKIIVPDFKKSEVGKNFIEQRINSPYEIKKASSWTNGLSLFNQSKNIAFYTFSGSLFYFKDKLKKPVRSNGIEGVYKEYFQFINYLDKNDEIFEDVMLSQKIQEGLWNFNYMYPVKKNFMPESLKNFNLRESFVD